MKMLVTGGAGFIGHHLVHALVKEGHEVIVLDNLSSGDKSRLPKEAEFIQGDVLQINSLSLSTDIDTIFHLAAQIDVGQSLQDPLNDAEQNVLGTLAVADFAKRNGIPKVIFSSTAAVYGDTEALPLKEAEALNPKVPYGLSKLVAEQYLTFYADNHGFQAVILRYANVYGPGQSTSKESGVISVFCKQVAEQKPLQINGDGENTRDFVYVEDIVRANIAAAKQDISGVFNISTETEVSLNTLVELLQECSEGALEVTHAEPREGDIIRSCLANKKAKQQLSWEPQESLISGLKKTLDSLS